MGNTQAIIGSAAHLSLPFLFQDIGALAVISIFAAVDQKISDGHGRHATRLTKSSAEISESTQCWEQNVNLKTRKGRQSGISFLGPGDW